MKARAQTIVYVWQDFYRTHGREEVLRRLHGTCVGLDAMGQAVVLLQKGASVMCLDSQVKEIK